MRRSIRIFFVLLIALTGAVGLGTPVFAATAVTGTATDPDGNPITGTAYLYADQSGNGNGNYVTAGVISLSAPAGDYQLRVDAASMDGYALWYVAGQPEGTSDRALATTVHLDGTTPVTLDPIVFPRIATVSGTVRDGNGDPVAGVTVFRNLGGMYRSAPPTDALGHFSFGYHRPGTTTFSVNATDTLAGAQVTMSVPTSGHLDVDLTMSLPSHISGALTEAGSGRAVHYLQVSAIGVGGGAAGAYTYAYTDATGHYDIGGLHSGDYVLRYNDYDHGFPTSYNGGGSDQGAAPHLVTVAGGTLVHDEALVPRPDPRSSPFTLAGTVRDATALGIAGLEVTARSGADVLTTTTDRSGRWAFDAPPGEYTIRAANSSWLDLNEDFTVPWFPEYYPDAWDASDATTVIVPVAGQVDNLDVELVRAARLTTTVFGPGGSQDLSAGYRVYAPDGTEAVDHVPATYEGNRVSILLRPGTWKVLVTGWSPSSTNATRLLPQWYGGSGATITSATPVSVVAGDEIDGGVLTLPAKLATTTPPKLKGKAKVGKSLTATKGVWNLMTGTTFTFTWSRGGKVIGHKSAHTVTAADRGKKLTVKVRASNGDFVATRTIKVKIPR